MKVIDLMRHTAGLTYGFLNRTNLDAAYAKLGVAEPHTEGGLAAMIAQLENCRWNSARRGVELFRRRRCAGLSGGDDFRPDFRRFRARPDPQTAGHDAIPIFMSRRKNRTASPAAITPRPASL
jgi:hypothetical protein